MSASEVAELALLQGLREQQARRAAATAEQTRVARDRAAGETRAALEHELARYAETRAELRLCLDRVGFAAKRVTLAVTAATAARDEAEASRREQAATLQAWQEAASKDGVLRCRAAQLKRTEDRKAADRRDLAAIAQGVIVAKDTGP